MVKKLITTSLAMLIVMTLITGVIYPLLVTGIAAVVFPRQAHGSLIVVNEKAVGSALIGQSFDAPAYFWGRLSATSPTPYNAAASSGSNLGPTNPALLEQVAARMKALKDADPENTLPIPVDLVTASASGLDPEISPLAAVWQARRVARARGLEEAAILKLIESHVEPRALGVLGEPRVNVLKLNLALDASRGRLK